MRWILTFLIFLTSCSDPWGKDPWGDPSCTGLAPIAPAISWSPNDLGWPSCKLEETTLKPEDFTADKTLTELMDMALSNNPSTKTAWGQARMAAYAFRQSKAPYFPQVQYTESFDSIDEKLKYHKGFEPSQTSILGYYQTWTREWNISYLLFDFGGRYSNMMAFKMALFSSNWMHAQSVQDVMNSVQIAYYNYLSNKSLVKAKEFDLKDAQANYEAAQAKFAAGTITKVDVIQFEAQVYSIKVQLAQLQSQVNIALGSLATALGLPANAPLKIKELPEKIPILEIDKSLDELIALAKQARPDLNSVQALYLESYYNTKLAESQFMPTLTSNVSLQNTNYSQSPVVRSSHDYDAAISLNIPLFSGFNDYYNIKVQKSKMYAAYEAWAQQEATTLLNVVTSYYSVQAAIPSVKYAQEFLKFAEEAYSLNLLGYRAGTASYLDLLQSQTQLAQARSLKIQALTQWVSSLSNLAYAAGILAVTDEGKNLQINLEEIQSEKVK